MIDHLHIKNFKSVKDVKIDPKKVNVFIGRPNVGKSNIIESISMLNIKGHLGQLNEIDKSVVRFRSIGNLFNNKKEAISIQSNITEVLIKLEVNNSCRFLGIDPLSTPEKNPSIFSSYTNLDGRFIKKAESLGNSPDLNIKLYKFREKDLRLRNIQNFQTNLNYPFGENLMSVIESDIELTKDFAEILQEYELDLVFIDDDRKFVIQKKEKSRINQLPLELIADTIKRYIFYLVSIKTNKYSTLIFEEPESNSFPPYIVELAENIAVSNNQFFITTHSPYILETLFNRCEPNDLAIYHIEYQNHETVANLLPRNSVKELLELKGDVFYNLGYFNNIDV